MLRNFSDAAVESERGSITPRFDITLVGEANMDLLLYGLPEALPLERELRVERMESVLGGSPAITAHNLAALGSRVGFITMRSEDDFGTRCMRELTLAGVDTSSCIEAARHTGLTIFLQHAARRRAFTYPGNAETIRLEDLNFDYLTDSRHFHLSSFFLQRALRDDVPELFRRLKQSGLTISLDTNDDPWSAWAGPIAESLPYVDVLMPNAREACQLASEPDLDRAIAKLRRLVPLLVVKEGASGARAFYENRSEHAAGVSVASVDAVGAGDSFNAGFLHGYVQGWPVTQCLSFGNLTGAYSTTQTGGTTAFRDRAAMKAFVSQLTERV